MQLAFGFLIGRLVIAWLLLPQYLRGERYSAYQLLRERFNPAVQRTASALFLVTRTLVDGLRLSLTALLLQQFTGWDISVSILALGLVTLIYTYLGGMEAVIWTDLIQFAVYLGGAIIAGVFIIQLLPGGWAEFWQWSSAHGRLQVIDLDWSPTKRADGLGGVDRRRVRDDGEPRSGSEYGAALLVCPIAPIRPMVLGMSGVVIMVQFTLFLLIGLGLAVLSSGAFAVPEGTRNDEVFGRFIVTELPHGLVGLVTAAVLASAMASFSSSLNSAASAFVADFYRPLRPNHSERFYLRLSKAMTSVWGVAKIGVALVCVPLFADRSIVNQVLAIAAVTTGLILGLFALGSLRRPVHSTAALDRHARRLRPRRNSLGLLGDRSAHRRLALARAGGDSDDDRHRPSNRPCV